MDREQKDRGTQRQKENWKDRIDHCGEVQSKMEVSKILPLHTDIKTERQKDRKTERQRWKMEVRKMLPLQHVL